jgi:GT2 family glycosyltransferase
MDAVYHSSRDFPTTHIVSPTTIKLQEVGVGITTRDRWDDLAVTLSELKTKGYEDVETIVIDDGSEQPVPMPIRAAFPKVRFERVERSLGLVVQRNRLAQMLTTTYYLSLDDDSFPIHGDISDAIIWLENHPSVVALALRIVQTNATNSQPELPREPFPVRYYIGCGHLLRRQKFLELGGYLEFLHYFSEEVDFCLNALLHGFSVYAYPDLVIRHNRTQLGRSHAKAARYYMRNQVIIGFLYFPLPFFILRALNCLRLLRNPTWNAHPGSLLIGWFEAFGRIVGWRKHRRRLSLAQFRAWRKLPLPRE